MPDFTIASAMLLIMSSLTLQANLFHEFQPMGGVSARLRETLLFSCANGESDSSKIVAIARMTFPLIFMRAFYQKTRRFTRAPFAK